MRHQSETGREEHKLSLEGLWELFGRNTRLVVTTVAVSAILSVVVLALRAPSYRAKATLILDENSEAAGILGEIAMLGKAPQAAGQIEILRARSTAEETVSSAHSDDAEDRARHLGLTTLVEDPLLKPLDEALHSDEPDGRLPARLLARFTCPDEFDSLRELEVEFLDAQRVRVTPAGLFSERDPVEGQVGPQGVALDGCALVLEPQGDLSGRTFRVRRLTRDEAIERVMDATRARETERNSGVIELTFDDSDPRRAAETANALCRNYLQRNETRGNRRASHTVEFIESSLENQLELLHQAEVEVVELQRANPRAINMMKSAEVLIEQLSQLEAQRMQLELSRISTRQAVALLGSGDMDALSQLSVELADPITAAYLENIAKLTAEHALQERSDTGPFKLMLQQHQLELQQALDASALQCDALQAVLEAIDRDERAAISRLGGGPPASADPLLESYLSTLGGLESRAALLAETQTEEHPDRIENKALIGATVARIRGLVASRFDALQAQRAEQQHLLEDYRQRTGQYPAEERARIDAAIASLRARTGEHLHSRLGGFDRAETALLDEVVRIEGTLGSLPAEERRIAEPMRKLKAHTEIVKLLLAKQQEAEITKASTIASAEFIDLAVPPLERSAPSIPLHVALGLVLGVLAALGLSFAKETFARGIFTSAELELATRLAVLGTIPDFRRGRYKVRGAGTHFLPLRDDPDGATAEAYRSLRANLKFAFSGEREIRSIAVTSCTQGEGKSSTNAALAMSFAKSGRRVLLVDCDMRRPSIEKYTGVELAPGLSDVLEGRTSWREAVRSDVFERVDVLTAGKQPPSPSDLLDSRAFVELLAELEREYDLVVCDVPPAMAVSDIESCASQIDALILLVRSNKVSARVVEEAARRLKQTGANLIGAVLNGVGTSLANGKYGYGYGYGYGQRNDERKRAAG